MPASVLVPSAACRTLRRSITCPAEAGAAAAGVGAAAAGLAAAVGAAGTAVGVGAGAAHAARAAAAARPVSPTPVFRSVRRVTVRDPTVDDISYPFLP